MSPKQKPHRSAQDVCTPPEFIEAVQRRFGQIGFDYAATTSSGVAGTYGNFSDLGVDSLSLEWSADKQGRDLGWINPPYGDIKSWAKKAADSASIDPHLRLAMLVPASVGSAWYRRYVHRHAYVLALEPRLKFVGHDHCFPKDLILVLYQHGLHGFDTWRWKP